MTRRPEGADQLGDSAGLVPFRGTEPPRILLADRDLDVCFILEQELRTRFGVDVIVARSGAEAADQIASGCDALITELDLPFGSGLYLLDAAARQDPSIRMFVFTDAVAHDSGVRAARERGAKVFLKSPEEFLSLLQAVAWLIYARDGVGG